MTMFCNQLQYRQLCNASTIEALFAKAQVYCCYFAAIYEQGTIDGAAAHHSNVVGTAQYLDSNDAILGEPLGYAGAR